VRTHLLFPVSAGLGLLATLALLTPDLGAARTGSRVDVLPLEAVKKGMKGFGLTVFEGTEPARFGVTVIDVLKNFRPHQDLILVNTDHPRLDVAKIVAGMSGSPIYLDGKMAGAYSYGWSFGTEPVAGVTPIESMLSDLDRPLPPLLHGIPLLPGQAKPGAGPVATLTRKGQFDPSVPYDLKAHAAELLARRDRVEDNGGLLARPIATPLQLSGMGGAGRRIAHDLLAPLGFEVLDAGGGARSSASSQVPFQNGGAIGVELISGDMSAMGIGTVTRVEGDKLVAFGHPMMEVGVTSLPTSQARVLWFLASQQRSFKIGEGAGARGALVNDRQASIVVDQKAVAPTVPVKFRVEGEPGAPFSEWNFRVAHDPFLTPALLGMAIGSGLSSAAAERREVTFTMTSRVRVAGFPEVVVQDFTAGPTGTPDSAQIMQSFVLATVGGLFSNPWQDIRLESVDVEARLTFEREVAVLRAAEIVRPEIAPGEPAEVRVWLEPHGEKVRSFVVSVPLPANLKGQEVKIAVRPGYSVPKVKAPPESLAQMVANLPEPSYAPRSLVFSVETGEGGVAYAGQVIDPLPPGALDRLTPTSASLGPLEFRAQAHTVKSLPYFVVGAHSVQVRIKKNP
jgi:hypothetical protein